MLKLSPGPMTMDDACFGFRVIGVRIFGFIDVKKMVMCSVSEAMASAVVVLSHWGRVMHICVEEA